MAELTVERTWVWAQVAGVYVFAGTVVALFVENTTALVTIAMLGSGSAAPWQELLPGAVPEVGENGRAVFWATAGMAGLGVVERTTAVDVTGSEKSRKRAVWALFAATILGVVATLVGILWLLGSFG